MKQPLVFCMPGEPTMTCHLGSFAAMQPVQPNVNFTLISQPKFRWTCCTTADNLGPKYVSLFKNCKILSNETKKRGHMNIDFSFGSVYFPAMSAIWTIQYWRTSFFFLSSIFSSKPKGGIPRCSVSVYIMLFRPARKLFAAKNALFCSQNFFSSCPKGGKCHKQTNMNLELLNGFDHLRILTNWGKCQITN